MKKERKEFFRHLTLYIIVNMMLFLIDFYDLNGESPDQWWFYWTTLFWGIGLLIHGIDTFLNKKNKPIQQ